MTISEAIELLTPLGKRLRCSVFIEPPGVWLHSHRNYEPRIEQWKIYLGQPVDNHYCGPTLKAAIQLTLATHREDALELTDAQAAANEIDALAAVS